MVVAQAVVDQRPHRLLRRAQAAGEGGEGQVGFEVDLLELDEHPQPFGQPGLLASGRQGGWEGCGARRRDRQQAQGQPRGEGQEGGVLDDGEGRRSPLQAHDQVHEKVGQQLSGQQHDHQHPGAAALLDQIARAVADQSPGQVGDHRQPQRDQQPGQALALDRRTQQAAIGAGDRDPGQARRQHPAARPERLVEGGQAEPPHVDGRIAGDQRPDMAQRPTKPQRWVRRVASQEAGQAHGHRREIDRQPPRARLARQEGRQEQQQRRAGDADDDVQLVHQACCPNRSQPSKNGKRSSQNLVSLGSASTRFTTSLIRGAAS